MVKKIQPPVDSRLNNKDFLFGVATSSFQIEGAATDRLKCIWDTFCETPHKIKDNSNGLKACEHVQLFDQDVALIDDLGFGAYRLSISWPRVMGLNGEVDEQGIHFYKSLLAELKARNIKTFVTLYHWDLPEYVENKGGWLNRDTAYLFANYVKLVVSELNGLVDFYATLNEPFCSAHLGYEVGIHAPGKTGRKNGRTAAHHLLLAHGLAMQVLSKYSPTTKNGVVLNFTATYPASAKDEIACELANQYMNLWYAQPILAGSYPEVLNMLDEVDKPDILAGDLEIISHPIDYLGVNYYSRNIIKSDDASWYKVVDSDELAKTSIGWEIFPQGLTDTLVELNDKFNLPEVFITENGAAFNDVVTNGQVEDTPRIDYFNAHFDALDKAIKQGVNVKGYFAWSLMDNFEWAEGYSQRFGIVHVDFENQIRTIKHSGYAFQEFLQNRE